MKGNEAKRLSIIISKEWSRMEAIYDVDLSVSVGSFYDLDNGALTMSKLMLFPMLLL